MSSPQKDSVRTPYGQELSPGGAALGILPSGAFDRRDDPVTGRRIVVAGTYHPAPRAPVGPLAAAIAVPRGFVAAADVIARRALRGGAWVGVDRLGTLPALVAVLVARFRRRGLWAILPARPRSPQGGGLSVLWMVYRGPAKVTFEPEGYVKVNDGKSIVKATYQSVPPGRTR